MEHLIINDKMKENLSHFYEDIYVDRKYLNDSSKVATQELCFKRIAKRRFEVSNEDRYVLYWKPKQFNPVVLATWNEKWHVSNIWTTGRKLVVEITKGK